MKLSEINGLCGWLENNSIPETTPDGTNRYPMIRASAMLRFLARENHLLQLSLEHCLSQHKNELQKHKASGNGS